MPISRLPKAKYRRALREIELDLHDWRNSYLDAAMATDNPWLEERFRGRAYYIEEIIRHLSATVDLVDGLPRIT